MYQYDENIARAAAQLEWERRHSVNPPFNLPKPPPHLHEDGFNPLCGLCLQLREQDRMEHPERSTGRER